MMKKNIFLTGAPSSGKTTVIRKVIKSLTFPANGFYTEEERIAGKRVGFLMHTLDGRKGYLGHQDIKSDFHIRRYGVSIENIETIAVPSITPVSRNIIILDEIGKMECFSELFRHLLKQVLDSDKTVLATIALKGDGFIEGIKKRADVQLVELVEGRREILKEEIVREIKHLVI
jgi:nucleoside-triphosphatase